MSDLATMRTDVIGSLLRPERLKQARHRFDAGDADAAELRAVEEDCIREAVALQEGAGLGVVTDGEFRRLNFQDSFGACVEGFRSTAPRMEILENQSRHGKALQRWDVHRDVEAGCRYVQIDAPGYTAYVDEPSIEAMRRRGEDPDANLERSIAADNRLLEAFGDAVSGIHLCRGNQRSMWHREGAYDAVAERLFGGLKHRRLLLEYDSERAGGFEPLRFVPKGTVVVLGLVSTKVPELESVDDLKRRIDDAARFLPLEQLAVSPQCGFSSDVVGNLITPDDQKRKLDRVVETSRQVWG